MNEDGTVAVRKSGTRYFGNFVVQHARGYDAASVTTLLRNHQNSATTEVAATGTVTRRRYKPYGQARSSSNFTGTERGFLDKHSDPNGLVMMGARYYDPSIGRFVTPDPLADPLTPQSLAAYTYAGGNPTSFVDPTGFVRNDAEGAGSLDSECVEAGNCSEKYTETQRTRATSRAVYQLGGGYMATHSQDDALIRTGRGDLVNGQQTYIATLAAQWHDEMLSHVGLLVDELELVAYTSAALVALGFLGVGAIRLAPAAAPAAPAATRAADKAKIPQITANQAAGNALRDRIASRFVNPIVDKAVFDTPLGARRIDVLTRQGVAIETKVGRVSLDSTIRAQIAKDEYLLKNDPTITKAEWVFGRSGVTGDIGPTRAVENALQKAGISWSFA